MRVCPHCRSIYSVAVDRCGIDGTAIVERAEDPFIGSEIDRFHVEAAIGRGAMGCVYRARHNVLGTECAIKVLYGNFAVNARLMERFRREAQAVAQMNHPNIVQVVDFGRTEAGLTFLVMELVEGRTLEKAIEREAPFDPRRAAQIARQIASGLGEAHRRGFVHRDLKPANVMLGDVDGFEMVKLLDFGVVGLLQAAAAAKLTAAGHIVGTPSYMAPEQARTSSVSPSADLYALGCILYEMLAGRPPFEGATIAEVLLKHLHEQPRPLGDARGLEKLAMALLEKEPHKRASSAARVIAELDRLSLGAANTEQILVSRVLQSAPKAPPPVVQDGDKTAPVAIAPEHDTADMPISRIASAARRDPGEPAPLVAPDAPPLRKKPRPPHPHESETELDLQLGERPELDKTAPRPSFSAKDTERPEDADTDEQLQTRFSLMQTDTVHDLTIPPVARSRAGLALSSGTLVFMTAAFVIAAVAIAAVFWRG